MFPVINTTPFKAASAAMFDPEGRDIAVIAVKASFAIPRDRGKPVLATVQPDVLSMDDLGNDPFSACIRYPSDLVPLKKATDIGLTGTVYSPGPPVKKLKASVSVGSLAKEILAVGDRFWTRGRLNSAAVISGPDVFQSMPLAWERMFGGKSIAMNGEKVVYPENPKGTGFVLPGGNPEGIRLPNFEDPGNPIKHFDRIYPPATFWFSSPCAERRRAFAGTCDETWMENRRPLYPKDFDSRFFNCAQPGLIGQGYLKGGEEVTLVHLTATGMMRFRLPEVRVTATFKIKGELYRKTANLHTLIIEPDVNRFVMTWGTSALTGKSRHHVEWIDVEITTPGEYKYE
jgi:hypothetical protein